MTCLNPECTTEKLFAKGYCQKCYYRLRRTGSLQRTNAINAGANCSVDGCAKAAVARGLCAAHYDTERHDLIPFWRRIRSRHPGNYPDHWEQFSGFLADVGERPTKLHKLRRKNESLPFSAENVQWNAPVMPGMKRGEASKSQTYAREWQLLRNFGITLTQYAEMFKAQDGKCAICNKPETAKDRMGNSRPLCVDHCHKSGNVRELLCNRCNHMLGLADDDIPTMESAIAYLKAH